MSRVIIPLEHTPDPKPRVYDSGFLNHLGGARRIHGVFMRPSGMF